jgi:hypothetical protein
MKTAAVIFLVAIGLLFASSQMQPFATMNGGDWSSSVPQGDSNAYHEARAKALTPKYRLQDYGFTLAFVAVVVAVLSRKRGLSAPGSGVGFAVVALAAPLLTAADLAFDLLQSFERQEFPPWSDSMSIPLAGIPVIALALLIWSCAHFAFLAGSRKRPNVKLSLGVLRGGNKWLLLVAASTALLVAMFVADGAYYMAGPGALWLYYYCSILAVRGPHGG